MSSDSDQVWTVLSMLEWGTEYFEKKGVDSPRMSMEWLLAYILEIKRLDIYLQFDRPLSKIELDKIRPLIKRRAHHEPLQHLTGSTDFMGIPIQVNQDVLIPRSETEQLVELILEEKNYDPNQPLRLLDIGTGSGCIPIAIKKFRPMWLTTGIDISDKALDVAKKNASHNQTEISFRLCDLMEIESHPDIAHQDWDIIVSNPPYITPKERDSLDSQVKDFEPSLALFHEQPIELYERITRFASQKHADLYFECNNKSIERVKDVVTQHYNISKIGLDYSGNKRFVVGINPSK